jgi:hypothetical protein
MFFTDAESRWGRAVLPYPDLSFHFIVDLNRTFALYADPH